MRLLKLDQLSKSSSHGGLPNEILLYDQPHSRTSRYMPHGKGFLARLYRGPSHRQTFRELSHSSEHPLSVISHCSFAWVSASAEARQASAHKPQPHCCGRMQLPRSPPRCSFSVDRPNMPKYGERLRSGFQGKQPVYSASPDYTALGGTSL